jgi:hypothetical protein
VILVCAFAAEKAKRSKEKNNFIVTNLMGIKFKNKLRILFACLRRIHKLLQFVHYKNAKK